MVASNSNIPSPLEQIAALRKASRKAIYKYKGKKISEGTYSRKNTVLLKLKADYRHILAAEALLDLHFFPIHFPQHIQLNSLQNNTAEHENIADQASDNHYPSSSSSSSDTSSSSPEVNSDGGDSSYINSACDIISEADSAGYNALSDSGIHENTSELGSIGSISPATGNTSDAADMASGSGTSNPEANLTTRADSDAETEVNSITIPDDDVDKWILSQEYEIGLDLYSISQYSCSAETLRGVYCGSFGTAKPQSIIAYGPRHLSSWTTGNNRCQSDFTGLLPNSIIKKAVPLSQNFIGMITDSADPSNTDEDGELLIFDINTALSDGQKGKPSNICWPDYLPHHKGISTIHDMYTEDDRTYFLTGGKHSTEVVLHSYKQDGDELTNPFTMPVKANLGGQVSALAYDKEYKRIISGSVHGKISIADAYTGKFIGGGWLDENDASKGLKFSSFAFCPSNPNLLMATCNEQHIPLRFFDMRTSICNVLSLGADIVREYPEEMTPAWNPNNGQVVIPLNMNYNGSEENCLAVVDTRYANWTAKSATLLTPFNTETWSVSFGREQGTGKPIMVTAGDNGCIGITKYRNCLQ